MSRAGYGSPGYCRVCDSDLLRDINARLRKGQAIAAIERWLRDDKGFPVSQPTLRRHREHITDPKTTFVESARKNPRIKRGVTTQDFLQTLVEIGAEKADADPDSISIDQSIRAAQILEGRKDKQVDVLLVIARSLMGQAPPEIIEGEYREVLPPVKEITTSEPASSPAPG